MCGGSKPAADEIILYNLSPPAMSARAHAGVIEINGIK